MCKAEKNENQRGYESGKNWGIKMGRMLGLVNFADVMHRDDRLCGKMAQNIGEQIVKEACRISDYLIGSTRVPDKDTVERIIKEILKDESGNTVRETAEEAPAASTSPAPEEIMKVQSSTSPKKGDNPEEQENADEILRQIQEDGVQTKSEKKREEKQIKLLADAHAVIGAISPTTVQELVKVLQNNGWAINKIAAMMGLDWAAVNAVASGSKIFPYVDQAFKRDWIRTTDGGVAENTGDNK